MVVALRHAVLSCGGTRAGSALPRGLSQPRAALRPLSPQTRHPAGPTYCSHGRLQLVQPVPQPARGLVPGIHLQGERPGKERPCGAAAQLARGRARGEALTQPRTSSRAWVKNSRGCRDASAKLGAAGSSSMAVVMFSSAATSSTRSDICGWESPGLATRSSGAEGWGSRRPALGCGWSSTRLMGEVLPPFTASSHSYRQVYCVPFPMEEPGVAFVVVPLRLRA